MEVISIRLSAEEFEELQAEAQSKGICISTLVKNKIFPQHHCLMSNELIMETIREKKESGQLVPAPDMKFTLRELFDDETYKTFTNVRSAGRHFFVSASTPNTKENQMVIAHGGKPALYSLK